MHNSLLPFLFSSRFICHWNCANLPSVTIWSAWEILRRLADGAAVVAAFAIAYAHYVVEDARHVPYSFAEFLGLGLVSALVLLIVFQYVRLYERDTSLLQVVETRRILIAWTFTTLLVVGFFFFSRVLDLSRFMVMAALGVSLVLLLLERSLMHHAGVRLVLASNPSRRALIYGAGVVGKHLYKRIYHSPSLGIKVIGFLDDDSSLWGQSVRIPEIGKKNGNKVLGALADLPRLKEEHQANEIYIGLPSASYQRNLEIAEYCRKLGFKVSVVPPTYGHLMHNLDVREIGGIPVIQEKEISRRYFYTLFKRVFDLVVAAAALLILSPIFLAVAALIRWDSPGPVIFRQKRVGLNGKEFHFFKFRSMFIDANPYGVTPSSSDDPRITKFGRWLRRSSLDELPQFLNVLAGDMSIVGPRPEMPFIVATYNEEQRERLKVKPGITGVWQISAVRGEPIHANMEYDLFYIEHRSLLLDVIIMVKTVGTAIRGIGAV
jgi:exopolysaccharide biosynthesis polyprenyl glycosylphosphotransferase